VVVAERDVASVDVGAVLRGVMAVDSAPGLVAVSILRGDEYPITQDELAALLAIPTDRWTAAGEAGSPELIQSFAARGLVVSDADDPGLAELRKLDDALRDAGWDLYGALYHALGRWQGVRAPDDAYAPGAEPEGDGWKGIEERYGLPPPGFHAVGDPATAVSLPEVTRAGGLYEALEARRTARLFDRTQSVSQEDLAALLFYTFGFRGSLTVGDHVMVLARTSPSGGGLHPIEAYPLVLRADGVDTGLYHYNGRDHSLEPIRRLDVAEASALAERFTAGQTYFRDAALLVILTVRFPRTFWKYRQHPRAYAVMLMDAAHLSQTFYLVSTELGLGAFVTAAINARDIDEALGLDGFSEGAVAISGCGHVAAEQSSLHPAFGPVPEPER
jgi:putative peptide maturation dehydrogenase